MLPFSQPVPCQVVGKRIIFPRLLVMLKIAHELYLFCLYGSLEKFQAQFGNNRWIPPEGALKPRGATALPKSPPSVWLPSTAG